MAVCSAARRAVSSPRDPASWGRRCHSVLSPSTTWPLGSPRAWLARVALALSRVDGHRGHSRDVRVLGTAERGGGSGRPQGRKGVLRVFPALSSDTLKTDKTPSFMTRPPCSAPAGPMEEQVPRLLLALWNSGKSESRRRAWRRGRREHSGGPRRDTSHRDPGSWGSFVTGLAPGGSSVAPRWLRNVSGQVGWPGVGT